MATALEDRREIFFSVGFKRVMKLVLSNLPGALLGLRSELKARFPCPGLTS